MAIRNNFTAGEVLAAADLNDTFAAKLAAADQKILQVISTVKTDTFTTSSATYVEVTGFTATLTPAADTNKVLVIANFSIGQTNEDAAHSGLFRGNTQIFLGDSAPDRVRAAYGSNFTSVQHAFGGTVVFLDSPAVATAVTYGIRLRRGTGGNATFNRTGSDSDAGQFIPRNAASLTLIEVKS